MYNVVTHVLPVLAYMFANVVVMAVLCSDIIYPKISAYFLALITVANSEGVLPMSGLVYNPLSPTPAVLEVITTFPTLTTGKEVDFCRYIVDVSSERAFDPKTWRFPSSTNSRVVTYTLPLGFPLWTKVSM